MDVMESRAKILSLGAKLEPTLRSYMESRFGADFALSTVGLAGPGGGTPEKPVGLVYAGLAWDGGVASRSYNWLGTRAEIQSRTAKLALNNLRLHLLSLRE